MTVSQSEATSMSIDELTRLGRFNLRVLAQSMGLLGTMESRNSFLALGSSGQAELLFRELQPVTSLRAWAKEAWVSDLFLEYSMLKSISERDAADGYSHAYVVTANVDLKDGGDVHYLIIRGEPFTKAEVAKLLDALLEDGPSPSSRWLGEIRGVMGCTVDRAALKHGVEFPGYGLLSDKETAEELNEIMDKHGAWMLGAMQTWPAISAYGRRGNKNVSPNTYLIELGGGADKPVQATWMKYPDVEKIRRRIKSERHRWKPLSDHDLHDCRLIITRAMVFAHYKITDNAEASRLLNHNEPSTRGEVDAMTEERIAQGYERRQPSKEERMARERAELACDGCGCSLATNQVFGSGEARHCGECELKGEAENGVERTVNLKIFFVGKQRRMLPPKRSTKFDARPGIDDVGLGFSSPTWED